MITSLPSGYLPHGSPERGVVPAEAADQLRARALEQLLVAGTPNEERFDRLTRLAQRVFGVSVSNLTLLDGTQLHLKSTSGPEGAGPADVLAADQSFCQVGVLSNSILVVPDATADPRFAHLDAVVGPDHLRSYAGIPLTDDNGIAVGMFCIADSVRRTFTDEQLEVLGELAQLAQQELTARSEAQRARDVQQRLLPRALPQLAGYEMAAMCQPTQGVGGDFYDVGLTPDGAGIAVVDVMGKGTAAAILSATVRAALQAALHAALRGRHEQALAAGEPVSVPDLLAEAMADTAATVNRDLEDTDTLATAFYASLDPRGHRLSWVDAGHGLAVVVSAADASGSSDQWLTGADLPLGIDPDAVWHGASAAVAPGDTVLIFSDGLLDLLGGSALALHEIADLARSAASPQAFVDEVRVLLQLGVPTDDVTVVALRRRAD